MTTASLRTARRAALRRLADDVLEAPDLPALTRLLTRELPETLGAESATLLLWDRKLESFQGGAITASGRIAYITNGYDCGSENRGLHAFDLVTRMSGLDAEGGLLRQQAAVRVAQHREVGGLAVGEQRVPMTHSLEPVP